MKTKKNNGSAVFVVGLVAVLILINLILLHSFFRIDLTRDHKFTLSRASVETVARLEDVLTVSAYFSKGLPPPYAQQARYVNDLLAEYAAASKNGKFAFEFSDPTASETLEDKAKKKEMKRDIFGRLVREPTSIESELADLGLQAVEIRVIEDDEQQTKRAYMGIVVRYQDKHEVIPVVQDLADLEKNLTGLMRKLVRERMPKVGLVRDPSGAGITKLSEALRQNVVLEEVSLSSQEEISDDIDALLVFGEKSQFGEQGANKIDSFLRKGKSAALLMDRVKIDPRTFQQQPSAHTLDNSMFDLLSDYGITVESSLVADASCASLNMQENRGGFSFSLPVKYPFVPELLNLSFESPITKGLTGVILPFVANIQITEKAGLNTEVIARSSKVSWLEKEPFDLNPRRDWGTANIVPDGPYSLIVQARGVMPTRASKDEKPLNDEKTLESRLIVAGTSSFLWDDFLTVPNQVLALNMVDWMLADSALLEMRSRTFNDAPLDADLSDGLRQGVKYGNILGVPFLLALYGLLRWRLRESRRQSLRKG
ncbi:MAG: GldG family protein [Myxococcales bacterium]|nr:GldG family protein [Myxococcales bacterium]USN50659.1 MAG: GldG family protein [Myxococcales bacterium]